MSPDVIASWYTLEPSSGGIVRVRRAEEVEKARQRAFDAEAKVAVLCEAAARLRPLAHRALTESGASGDEARSELQEGLSWLARGGVEPRV